MLVAVWPVTSDTGIRHLKAFDQGEPQASRKVSHRPAYIDQVGSQSLTIEKFMRREAGIATPHA